MRLTSHPVVLDATGARLSATIAPERGVEIPAWYRVPPGWAPDQTASPFLPVATALATVYEEDLTVEGEVSTRLLEGARQATQLFAAYHHARRPAIHADHRPLPPRAAGTRHVGLFLSRGVDSTANLVLGDRGELDPKPTLAIVMANMETANTPAVDAAITRRSVEVAHGFGLDAVTPSTNLRHLLDAHIGWIDVFGCVLAGAAIALGHRLSDVIISSSGREQLVLLGSHPDLDHLWGTEWLDVHHLPRDLTRPERLRLLVEDGRALEFLKVCTAGAVDNCGRCQKCTQTAALLEVFGALDRCPVFPLASLDLEALRERPPSTVTTPDFVDTAAPTRPDMADAVLRDRGRDTALGLQRPSTTRLNEVRRRLVARPARALAWCAIGRPSAELAGAVAAARAAGPGVVWVTDDGRLPRPVLDRLLESAEVTFWCADEELVEVDHVVEVLAHGGRPFQVVAPEVRARLQRRLPSALRPLVGRPSDLAATIERPEGRIGLGDALVAGGTAWLAALRDPVPAAGVG
jgi:hypothetical protein